ncbi:MAG: GTPase Era [Candidatus Bipolaricaulia bacterium]
MRSGFVGVLGQTNVGKSSFINAILGRKVVIVSERIQTTRNRIRCIYNDEDSQIIFVDTPGLHKPVNKLSRYLLNQAYGALQGLDLLVYMVEPWIEVQPYDREVFKRLNELKLPAILLVNKVDLAKGNEVPETLKNYGELGLFKELVPISCKVGLNLGLTLRLIKENLPEGPAYFPKEELTDRSEEFLIAEFVREQIFQLTYQEIPYSTAVEVVELRERDQEEDHLIEIYADIYVARDSQKGILIGEGGRMIREIGTRARKEIERLLGAHVYLDLRVKVRKDWVEDERQIVRLVGQD